MSRIKRLVFKDCLGIKELAFNPGRVNYITGGNERGKTSILEGIEKALYNSDRRDVFVRAGEESAYIELTTDDNMKIERTVGADSTNNNVKVSLAGHPQTAPETFLKNLFGTMQPGKKTREVFAFNPVDFMAKKDAEQTNILLGLLPISFTEENASELFGTAPEKIDYTRHGLQVLKDLEKYWYDARAEANLSVKKTKYDVLSTANKLPDNYCLANWQDISLAELYDGVAEAKKTNIARENAQACIDGHENSVGLLDLKFNTKIREAQDFAEFKKGKVDSAHQEDRQRLVVRISEIDAAIIDFQKKIAEQQQFRLDTEKDLAVIDGVVLTGKKELIDAELVGNLKVIDSEKQIELTALTEKKLRAEKFLLDYPLIDIEPLQHKAEHAESMKTRIPLAIELDSINKRLVKEEATAELYNLYVNTCREKPAELLSSVDLPVKGLALDANGRVTFPNDEGMPLPISNHSTSKQVRICLDIARAYAKDNSIKLICVDKLEHFDEDIREEFYHQIEGDDQEFQYFVTLVTKGDLKIQTEVERKLAEEEKQRTKGE